MVKYGTKNIVQKFTFVSNSLEMHDFTSRFLIFIFFGGGGISLLFYWVMKVTSIAGKNVS
jgi:hypothetical protein